MNKRALLVALVLLLVAGWVSAMSYVSTISVKAAGGAATRVECATSSGQKLYFYLVNPEEKCEKEITYLVVVDEKVPKKEIAYLVPKVELPEIRKKYVIGKPVKVIIGMGILPMRVYAYKVKGVLPNVSLGRAEALVATAYVELKMPTLIRTLYPRTIGGIPTNAKMNILYYSGDSTKAFTTYTNYYGAMHCVPIK